MPLDPQAKLVLDAFAAAPFPDFWSTPVAELRAAMRRMRAPLPVVPVGEVQDRTVPGPGGGIPVRVYRPASGTGRLPALAFFHGGGWVLGDLESHDATCRRLANDAGCVVVSVDYRLAPEARFPAAAEDCYAATTWLHQNAASLGADPDRIAVGGDSAGGNLAAVTALAARQRGGPRLAHQLLVYPVTDFAFATASYRENAEGYFLTADMMRWFWQQYLEKPEHGTDPAASPLRAPTLAGVAPATVITAELDPLRDEGEAYGARLLAAGVSTTVTRYPGMIHGFFGMPELLDQARAAQAQAASELRRAFAR